MIWVYGSASSLRGLGSALRGIAAIVLGAVVLADRPPLLGIAAILLVLSWVAYASHELRGYVTARAVSDQPC